MNDLADFFYNKSEKVISKWKHYFDVYEKYFRYYRDEPVTMLEIGLYQCGSLDMWRDYFHRDSKIIGFDIDATCKFKASNNVEVYIGDQNNEQFCKSLAKKYEGFDIIIDDGSHINEHQINSFTWLWPYVKENGLYMIEDVHTSYWKEFRGGYKDSKSCVEFAKGLIDNLNAYHNKENYADFIKNRYSDEVFGIYFHDSIIVLEKKKRSEPPGVIVHKGR